MKRDCIELAEREADLDTLLSQWHNWQQSTRAARGYGRNAIGFEGYRASRQYDDSNGALDADLEHIRCRAVDFAAQQMQDPWRAAIYALARNLCTGYAVWASPRLPTEHTARLIIVTEARIDITRRLVSAGVIDE